MKIYLIVDKGRETTGHGESEPIIKICGYYKNESDRNFRKTTVCPAFNSRESAGDFAKLHGIFLWDILEIDLCE